MTRVDESRDAQRQEEVRRAEKMQKEKTDREKQEFSKLVTQKKDTQVKGEKQQNVAQGQAAGQRAAASTALLARQGIVANKFQAALDQQGGKQVANERAQSSSRSKETNDTKRADGEKQSRVDKEKVERQDDKLAAISRDDRRGGRQGGDSDLGGGAHSGSQQQDGKFGAAHGTTGAALVDGPQQAQQAQGVAAPRIPPQVIEEIVRRVMVGVNAEGLSEFHIEFKGDMLDGSRMQITAENGKISAKFSTDDRNVGRLLKASEGEMMRAFARKGLTLTRLEVEER